jgi:hypothetical protein
LDRLRREKLEISNNETEANKNNERSGNGMKASHNF